MAAPYIYVIGNCVPYDIKTLREDATGAQMKMQADACAHQRAKSRKATLCSDILSQCSRVRSGWLQIGFCGGDNTGNEARNLQTRLLAVHAEPASVSDLKTETSVQRFRRRVRTDDLQVGVGSAPVVAGFKE